MSTPVLQDNIFRAYDIRGIVGEGLTAEVMYWLGKAIGSEAQFKGEDTLLLGCDARLSSPEFAEHMKTGILETGCNLVDLGQIPTPLMYFATHKLDTHSGVMITGSHNPREYNGVKIVFKQQALSDAQITIFRDRIFSREFYQGRGKATRLDISTDYLKRICQDISLNKAWKLVIDCGNAVTAKVGPALFRQLGCEVSTLFCDIDGSFPNHHPDPTQAENLVDLQQKILAEQAELGIAFDGDGDRVALVTGSGRIIDADHMLMAFIQDILPENPGATVVYDVKSSQHLQQMIIAEQGVPLMCKSGHSYVKKAMLKSGALLGGEFSSHLFFKHRWYGFDDGLYVAARFLELMDKNNLSADEILDSLPDSAHTPELFVAVPEQDKFAMMRILQDQFSLPGTEINQLDGLRVMLDSGWGLIRASNTTANLVLRFEAQDQAALAEIQQQFRNELLRVLPDLSLPF